MSFNQLDIQTKGDDVHPQKDEADRYPSHEEVKKIEAEQDEDVLDKPEVKNQYDKYPETIVRDTVVVDYFDVSNEADRKRLSTLYTEMAAATPTKQLLAEERNFCGGSYFVYLTYQIIKYKQLQ